METLFAGKAFRYERDSAIGVISFDLEGERVNKLSDVAALEMDAIINKIQASLGTPQAPKALLIRSLKKNSFIVGADIQLIKTLQNQTAAENASAQGQAIFAKLEDLKLPKMTAIEGPCMGGGTELALSCDYIVCSDHSKTVIGLPEVRLGLLPGWGGTYRLPKRVGFPAALDMILTGKSIRPDKAVRMGLVDAVIPSAIFTEKCLEWTQILAQGGRLPGLRSRKVPLMEKALTSNFVGWKVLFYQARQGVLKATRGNYPAPLKILNLLESHSGKKREAYLVKEAQAFGQLWATPESKNLVNLFFLNEEAKKNTGTSLSAEEAAKLPPIESCAVLGAGVMGGGIASQSAAAGLHTLVKDLQPEAVGKALAHARELFEKDLKRKRIRPAELNRRMGLIRGQTDDSGMGTVDLVIEAIVEIMDVKKKVLAEMEQKVRPDCLLASNTSSLRLTEMSSSLKDPGRFLGLHFFNPVHKMPLVEVVTHDKTRPEAVARAVAFVKKLGKTPLVCKDGPGFIVNRLLMPWLNESAYCLWEGYAFEDIERALKKFGMPMGPFELLDEIGIDVAAKVAHILHHSLGERAKPVPVMDKIGASKRLGRKSGLGFYVWDKPGGRRVQADTENILKLLFEGSSRPSKPEYTAEQIVRRTIYPMINEAAIILEEQLVTGPDQIDLGMIFGTGFPPFRGGLLRYADSIGLDKIVAELERMAQQYGPRFAPAPALKAFAASGSFYSPSTTPKDNAHGRSSAAGKSEKSPSA